MEYAETLIAKVEGCSFKCEAGPLALNVQWQKIKITLLAQEMALANIATGCNIAGLSDSLLQGNASSTLALVQEYARTATP